MSKKDNIPKGVRQEFEDIDYWHKLPKNKYVTMPDGSKISVYEYMKKFMHEAYGNNFSRENPESNILQTEEQKKWARRNNNNTNRDALNVIKKAGKMTTLFQIHDKVFSDQSSEDWEKAFKSGTYEQSFKTLLTQCSKELGIVLTDAKTQSILRVYFRIKKFLKMVRHDKRTQKDMKNE
jgi:hypothetical protein